MAGLTGLWALTEGSGTSAADTSVENRDGTFVGSPAWASGSYGPELGSFTTSAYVAIDATGDTTATQTAPYMFAVLFKNSGTTEGCGFGQGRSTVATPFIALPRVNSGGTAQLLEFDVRGDDNSLKNIQEASVTTNDGNYQMVVGLVPTTTRIDQFYMVGTNVVEDRAVITAPGSSTIDRCSIGALVRNTVGMAFPGTIVAVGRWAGDYPDPGELIHDWMSGAFSAIQADETTVPITYLLGPNQTPGTIWRLGPA